jgi:DUF438 domain-containing protein
MAGTPAVQEILDAFRSGLHTTASMRVLLDAKLVLVRYVAVRDGSNAYKGCLEICQDITSLTGSQGQSKMQWDP